MVLSPLHPNLICLVTFLSSNVNLFSAPHSPLQLGERRHHRPANEPDARAGTELGGAGVLARLGRGGAAERHLRQQRRLLAQDDLQRNQVREQVK